MAPYTPPPARPMSNFALPPMHTTSPLQPYPDIPLSSLRGYTPYDQRRRSSLHNIRRSALLRSRMLPRLPFLSPPHLPPEPEPPVDNPILSTARFYPQPSLDDHAFSPPNNTDFTHSADVANRPNLNSTPPYPYATHPLSPTQPSYHNLPAALENDFPITAYHTSQPLQTPDAPYNQHSTDLIASAAFAYDDSNRQDPLTGNSHFVNHHLGNTSHRLNNSSLLNNLHVDTNPPHLVNNSHLIHNFHFGNNSHLADLASSSTMNMTNIMPQVDPSVPTTLPQDHIHNNFALQPAPSDYSDPTIPHCVPNITVSRQLDISAPVGTHITDLVYPPLPSIVDMVGTSQNTTFDSGPSTTAGTGDEVRLHCSPLHATGLPREIPSRDAMALSAADAAVLGVSLGEHDSPALNASGTSAPGVSAPPVGSREVAAPHASAHTAAVLRASTHDPATHDPATHAAAAHVLATPPAATCVGSTAKRFQPVASAPQVCMRDITAAPAMECGKEDRVEGNRVNLEDGKVGDGCAESGVKQSIAAYTVAMPVVAPLGRREFSEGDFGHKNMVSSRSSTNVPSGMDQQDASSGEEDEPLSPGEDRPCMSADTPKNTGCDESEGSNAIIMSAKEETPTPAAGTEMAKSRKPQTSPSHASRKRGRVDSSGTPMTRKRRRNVDLASKAQVGDEISVYWANDKCYYDGVIEEQLADGRYRIVYFDDDVEILDLEDSSETWNFQGAAAERVGATRRRSSNCTAPNV